MQVAILGRLEVRDELGAPIKVTGARLRSVLVRLAMDAGRPVSSAKLADAVWGARPPVDEANALQTLMSRLRRALAGAASIDQSLPIMATVGVVLADIAADAGRATVAAEMLGAAARLRGADDTTSPDIARLLSALPSALGAVEFTRLYDGGKGLDRGAALARLDPSEALAGLSAQTRRL